MREVYNNYTGKEIAEVIGQIRKEIDLEQEKLRLTENIDSLTQQLKDLK